MKQFNSAQLNMMKLVAVDVTKLSLSIVTKQLALEVANALDRPSLDAQFIAKVTETLDDMSREYLSHNTIKVVIDSAHRKADHAIDVSCYELGIKGNKFFSDNVMSMGSRSGKTRKLVQYGTKEDEKGSSVDDDDYSDHFKGNIKHAIKRLEGCVGDTIIGACTRALLTGNYKRGILDKKYIKKQMRDLAYSLVNRYAPVDKPKADSNANSDSIFLLG